MRTSVSLSSRGRRPWRSSFHPGHDAPENVPHTDLADPATLELLRTKVALEVAETYPGFARRVWGVG